MKEVGIVYEIGISVKIRLLNTPEQTAALVSRLVATGITGLTIHCRTTPMRPRERAIRAQLRMIGEICREAGVACLMNGDVGSRDEALALAAEYGVDGGMIATAAEANSSVFRSEADGGAAPWAEVAARYVDFALAVDNRWGNTKFLLAQLLPGKAEAAKKCQQAKGYVDVVRVLQLDEEANGGGSEILERARDVDDRLGITAWRAGSSGVEKAKKQNKSAQAAGRQVHLEAKRSLEDGIKRALSARGVDASAALAAV